MRRADMWTDLRANTAPLVGALIASTEESWRNVGIETAEYITDFLDGRDAKSGATKLGIPTSVEGKIKDPLADKALTNGIAGGLTMRYIRRGQMHEAVTTGVNMLALAVRDRRQEKHRNRALEANVDPAAISINRAKTALQGISLTALEIPQIARSSRLRWLALGAFTTSTIMGIYGEKKFGASVEQQIKSKHAAQCPDEIESL